LISKSGAESIFNSGKAMQEDKTLHFRELDQILCDAQLRRSSDLSGWLTQYFEHRKARQQIKKLDLSSSLTTLHRPAV